MRNTLSCGKNRSRAAWRAIVGGLASMLLAVPAGAQEIDEPPAPNRSAESSRESSARQTIRGEVIRAAEESLTIRTQDRQQRTMRIEDETRIRLGGREVELGELEQGTQVTIQTEPDNPGVATQIEAQRQSASDEREGQSTERESRSTATQERERERSSAIREREETRRNDARREESRPEERLRRDEDRLSAREPRDQDEDERDSARNQPDRAERDMERRDQNRDDAGRQRDDDREEARRRDDDRDDRFDEDRSARRPDRRDADRGDREREPERPRLRQRDDRRFMREVREESRGGLGVTLRDSRTGDGVRVIEVHRNSPADEAGIREGDYILAIDREEIRSAGDITRLISRMDPGQRVRIELWRDGDERNVTATLSSRSEALSQDESGYRTDGRRIERREGYFGRERFDQPNPYRFDRFGYDREGYDYRGFNREGVSRDGESLRDSERQTRRERFDREPVRGPRDLSRGRPDFDRSESDDFDD